MVLKKSQIQIVLGVLVLLLILSSIAISEPRFTGFVVGIPSACKSKITIEAPKSIEIYAGETEEMQVKVNSVMCGVSYVRLKLSGISSELYTVGPSYHPVLSPGKTGNFSVFFDIPEGADEKAYAGVYTIYTNEGTFSLGEINLNVLAPEKPKVQVEAVPIVSGKQVVLQQSDRTIWYALGFFASILAIIIVGYEYFAIREHKSRKEALKRPEAGIYRALGVSPKKRGEFETALGKGKKKR